MKQLCMLVIMFFITSKILAQQVGIGTTEPHESAALHIQSSDKGVLFPKLFLQNATDKTTIASPAEGLMIFNLNANLSQGRGLYINKGNGSSPNWEKVGKQESFTLPYYGYLGTGPATNALEISSDQNLANSAAIKATASGLTTGILTFNGSGLALDVQGKVKISGNGQAPGAGKVLTSDASGNATWQGAVAFSATGVVGGGSEKLATQTSTKIPFALKEYDVTNSYNDANASPHSTFTAPNDGIYHFDVSVSWNTSVGNVQMSLNRLRNGGTSVLYAKRSPGGYQTIGGTISVDVSLKSGDQIFVSIYHTSQSYLTLSTGNDETFFTGHLVMAD